MTGGFDLAAEWMGWENIFHCEWNEFGQRVLKHYWPNADSLHDITKTDFTKYEGSIDIISGGFPCQPYSAAGKRLGKEDERHLWPEMLRAIREIKPIWVVGENVRGLVNWNEGLVFDEVQADLESEGYEVQPFLLPAAGVNAPHRRDRIWFVAYRNCRGLERTTKVGRNSEYAKREGSAKTAADTECNGLEHRPQPGGMEESKGETWERITGHASAKSQNWDATDTNHKGSQGSQKQRGTKGSRKNQNQQPTGSLQPVWEIFPTQSPICGGDDGIPRELDSITFPKWRNESIKAYGNAIVPQVALQIFKAIDQYENIKRGKDNN